jgi:hypothetical protein
VTTQKLKERERGKTAWTGSSSSTVTPSLFDRVTCTVHIIVEIILADPDPGNGVFYGPWIRKGKNSGSGKKHPESYFLELSNNFRG